MEHIEWTKKAMFHFHFNGAFTLFVSKWQVCEIRIIIKCIRSLHVGKKKQENNPRRYWKEKGFDSDEEYKIYQFVCGRLSLRGKRKINKEKQFYGYKSWQMHIEEIIECFEGELLSEFYRYIMLNRRQCDIDIDMHTSIYIPLIVAMTSGGLVQCVIGIATNSNVTASTLHGSGSSVLMGLLCAIILFIFMVLLGVGLCIIFYSLIDPYIKSKNETCFWEDCLEIVNNKMEEDKNKVCAETK